MTYRLILADSPGLRWVGADGKAGGSGEWVVLGIRKQSLTGAAPP